MWSKIGHKVSASCVARPFRRSNDSVLQNGHLRIGAINLGIGFEPQKSARVMSEHERTGQLVGTIMSINCQPDSFLLSKAVLEPETPAVVEAGASPDHGSTHISKAT
jgi:hypothetical protein